MFYLKHISLSFEQTTGTWVYIRVYCVSCGLSINADRVCTNRGQYRTTTFILKQCFSSFPYDDRLKYASVFEITSLKLTLLLTNENRRHDEVKRRLNSGNTCYHAVQNFVVPQSVYKNLNIKI